MPQNLVYQGEYLLTDKLPGDGRFTIASALLSPTRTYLPLLHKLFYHIERKKILGLIHCSGGGQTKIGKFGPKGIKYVKNNLFPIPPLFQELQSVQKLPMRQMYESYNMGHRLEAVVDSEWTAQQCIKVASTVNIDAQVIGYVTDKDVSNPQKRYVVIGDEEPYEF